MDKHQSMNLRAGLLAFLICLLACLVISLNGCGGPILDAAPVPAACGAPVAEVSCGTFRELADGTWAPCSTCVSSPVPGSGQRENDCRAPSGFLCVASCDQCAP